MTTTSTISTISTRLTWRLNLNISHINLSIKEENRSPITLFTTPIIKITSLFYIYDCNFRSVILDPLSSSFIQNSHVITLTIMIMLTIRSMIIMTFVKNNTHYSVFSSWFGVFDRLKPKLMINISIKEDIIQEKISLLILI